jgi:hypothetical protein
MEGCAIDVDRDTCRDVEQKREERRCEGQRLIGAGIELEMGQVSGMTLSAALCGVVGNSRPGIRLERSPFDLGDSVRLANW